MRRIKSVIQDYTNKKIEAFLYGRGLILHQVRILVRNQIYLSIAGSIIVLIFFFRSRANRVCYGSPAGFF